MYGNYVYVQGLRFRPHHVRVVWEDSCGNEFLVPFFSGRKEPVFGPRGVPLFLTAGRLGRVARADGAVEAMVRAMNGDADSPYEPSLPFPAALAGQVRLRLDPRRFCGRKGRGTFDPDSLYVLPQSSLRTLALEQVRTAPYVKGGCDGDVRRLLWAVEVLDDSDVAMMLEGTRTAPAMGLDGAPKPGFTLGWKNVDLAGLLFSDIRFVAALVRTGKNLSLRKAGELARFAWTGSRVNGS